MQHKLNFYAKFLTGLKTEFSFSWTGCHTKVKEHSLYLQLPEAVGIIFGFLPFPKVLA